MSQEGREWCEEMERRIKLGKAAEYLEPAKALLAEYKSGKRDFSGYDLYRIWFENGVNLSGITLKDADLNLVRLIGANLSGSDMGRMIDEEYPDTPEAGKSVGMKDANLSGANLSNTNLEGIDFQDANLSGANLSGTNLTDANLEGANLDGADLRNAYLRNAKFENATLRKAKLNGVYAGEASFLNADLSDADLSGVDFSDLNKYRPQLERFKIYEGRKYGPVRFSKANLSGANLIGAKFENCDMLGINLTNAKYNKSSFDRCYGIVIY